MQAETHAPELDDDDEDTWRSGEPGRETRVLLAEDDPSLRDVLGATLRFAGYRVVEAVSGGDMSDRLVEGRVEAWPDDAFDLVVTDVRMPGASGLEVVEQLRRRGCQTPIVVVTAFPDPELARRCRALDALLLAKPFPLRALRDAARFLLDTRPPRAVSPARRG